MPWRRVVPDERPTVAGGVIVGLGAACIGVLVRFVMQPALGNDLPFITFFPALLAAAIWGGRVGGMVCLSLTCFVAMAFFFPRADLIHLAGGMLMFLVSGGVLSLAGSELAANVRDLRENKRRMESAEVHLRTLVSELAHRGRNGLAVVMGIVQLSARGAGTVQELVEIVNARLGAMAQAQDEVIRSGGNSAALGDVLTRTLSPFDLDRFKFEPSPGLEVLPDTAASLALLAHELATNAVKYGALSAPNGQVQVAWEKSQGSVRLLWREHGGPRVSPPSAEGFGARLLKAALVSQGGGAQRRFEAEGVVCEIDFPHEALGPNS